MIFSGTGIVVAALICCVALLFVGFLLYKRTGFERDSAEGSREEWRSRALLIEERVKQAILVFDGRGSILRLNPAAERLLGYAENELTGQSILLVMPGAQADLTAGGDIELQRKNGLGIRVPFHAAKAHDDEMYLFFEDAPARTAAHGLTLVESVVGRIVRQFEGLLTTINGYTELALREAVVGSVLEKDLEELASASDQASSLARNLLAFSGNQLIPVEALDLNVFLEQDAEEFQRVARAEVRVEPCADAIGAMANADCLLQVVSLLCVSADRRTPPGMHITVRARRIEIAETRTLYTGELAAGTYSAISVSDSGLALAQATLDHLFEPLFLDREGVGIELSPIYGVVRTLGGAIDVESGPVRDTTIEILLPHVDVARGERETLVSEARQV